MADRVAELEATLAAEKAARVEEQRQAADRIDRLESRLREMEQKKFKSARPASANGGKSPAATKSASPAAADNTATSPDAKAPGSDKAASSNPTPRDGAAPAGKKKEEKKDAAPAPVDTAAQHAWDKFCARARNEFTTKELALVSDTTLKDLLVHYKFTSAVECAQIECQWALLQEGKQRVKTESTPKNAAPAARAKPYKPLEQAEPFNLRLTEQKPSLSRRSVSAEPPRYGDPNSVAERHVGDRSIGKGHMHVDTIIGCNPNMSPQRARVTSAAKRSVRGPATGNTAQHPSGRGLGTLRPPGAPEMTAHPLEFGRGKRPAGVKRVPEPTQRDAVPAGLKTGYSAPAERAERARMKFVPGAGAQRFQIA